MKATKNKVRFNIKHFLVAVVFIANCQLPIANCFAQNVGISATGTVPDNSAMLDVVSTTRGMLIPRMTTVQRDAIGTPATGLQVFNIDCNVVNYWSGTCWLSMSNPLRHPGDITTGTTDFCAGQTRTYSITAVPGATSYRWTVPAGATITAGLGTASITAVFGNNSGEVCVTAYNACESSPSACIDVKISPVPNTPGNITGPTSVPPGEVSVSYYIASVPGASSYNWTMPPGATITSGTGTTTIVVNYNCSATSGNISVTAQSICGLSAPSTLAITITASVSVNAGVDKFGGTTIGGTATGGAGGYAYSWSPAGDLSNSTDAIPTALCTGSTTTYTVTVTDANTCTATDAVVVTRNLAVNAGVDKFGGAAIGGTATGGAGSYAYAWTPANNLSSYTIATPTALCTGSTTTYTETVTDVNGCTATDAVVVTRTLAANAGADLSMPTGCSKVIGGSPTGSGGAGSLTYSWSPTTGLNDATLANPTSIVGSTTTYTVTVTDANGCTTTDAMTLTVGAGTSVPFTTVGSTTWTVLPGVTCIDIEVWGAQGGGTNGGLGARMKGTFTVTPGQVLKILVGGVGGSISSRCGGGGGSFVTDNSNNPLCIAGGGGGAGGCNATPNGLNGTTASSGTSYGSGMSGGGGINGGGGGGGQQGSGGGGGGLLGNGGSGEACAYSGSPGAGGNATNGSNATGGGGCFAPGGVSFIGGGAGGVSTANGGFGGGGSAYAWNCGGGGGGGYSGGGGGGYNGVQDPGGGGGSFNGGTSQSNSGGVRSGNGQIVITY